MDTVYERGALRSKCNSHQFKAFARLTARRPSQKSRRRPLSPLSTLGEMCVESLENAITCSLSLYKSLIKSKRS